MASLLVLGGSGYFGKSVLSAYQRGLLRPLAIDTVKIVARSASQLKITHPQLLKGNKVELHDLDLTTCDSLPTADLVIHAAASVDWSIYSVASSDAQTYIDLATTRYLTLARKYHRDSKIAYVSSGAVYGQIPSTVSTVSEDFVSSHPNSLSDSKERYRRVKQKAELTIKQLAEAGLNVSMARCFAFVGEFLPRNGSFAIGNFIEDGLNARPIRVQATHAVYRSYMHSDDLVAWLLAIAASGNNACPVYNVGSDQVIEIRELAKRVAAYFKQPVACAPILDESVDRYIPSIALAERKLGLTIKISLDAAIDQTVRSIRSERVRL